MKRTIFTGLSPNLESEDLRLTRSMLMSPRQWFEGTATRDLVRRFKKWLPAEHAAAFTSGRGALYALLSSLSLEADSEILLQAYTCVAAAEPILWIGARPVFVDIVDDTFNMDPSDLERKITDKSRVLIIQHTFGRPADVDALTNIAEKHGLLVVEDCCHALGAQCGGRNVGTFGDAAYFSFSRDKVISSVLGGMAVTNNEDLGGKIERLETEMPLPPRSWVFQQLMHPIVTSLAKSTYDLPPLGKLVMSASRRLGIIASRPFSMEDPAAQASFYCRKLPQALAVLALQQFEKLARFNAHRRNLAELYERELAAQDWDRPAKSRGDGDIYLRYTLRCEDADRIRSRACAAKILLGDWYTTPIAPGNVDYAVLGYVPEACPVADREAPRSLNLPTHIGITEEDALRIVKCLNEGRA